MVRDPWDELPSPAACGRPHAPLIAARALALGVVWARAQLEVEAVLEETRSPAHAEAVRVVLAAGVRALGLPGAFTPHEAALLRAPVGALRPEALVDASWRVEAAVPLIWALGLLERMPSYEEEVEAPRIWALLPGSALWDRARWGAWVEGLHLRPDAALEAERGVALERLEAVTPEDLGAGGPSLSVALERLGGLDWLVGVGGGLSGA